MRKPKKMHVGIILASNSPRRRELLRQIGLAFKVCPTQTDERVLPSEKPETYAVRVASDKASVAIRKVTKGIVIAADTIVVAGDSILGKPVDKHDAERMLLMLQGKMHLVMTGIAVMDAGTKKMLTGLSVTKVWFRNMTEAEIHSYVETGEPKDKAGAYGIQGKGALLVERIEGCYFNVVGLPLSLLGGLLRDFNVDILHQ